MSSGGRADEIDEQPPGSRDHEGEDLERLWTLTDMLDALTSRVVDWDGIEAVAEELRVIAHSMRSSSSATDDPAGPPDEDDVGVVVVHDIAVDSRAAEPAPGLSYASTHVTTGAGRCRP